MGPNSTIIGMSANPIMCIIPLSIEIAFSNRFERAVTSGGPDKLDSNSGISTFLISLVILLIKSKLFLSIKKTGFLFCFEIFLLHPKIFQ